MRSFTQKIILAAGIAGLVLAYQNCGSKHSMSGIADESSVVGGTGGGTGNPPADTPITGAPGATPIVPGEINAKLQLGDMLMRSFSSLTAVPVTTAAVVTEYNLRAPSMAGSLDPTAVTSPLMIAVTDLASVYCNTILTTESAQAAAQRRLFGSVDFTVAISQTAFDAMVHTLAQKFWGRDVSAAELSILDTNNTAFQAGFAAGTAAATKTRTTALFACSAMLSTFDVLTF